MQIKIHARAKALASVSHTKGDIMKIYHLIIAYNDKTEEIEYIQEEIEDDGSIGIGLSNPVEFSLTMEDEYFDDETLMRLIDEFGLGEA